MEIDLDKLVMLLRAKRGAMGLRAAAQQITKKHGSVSAATLSRVERGNLPDVETFVRLCRWLNISAEVVIVEAHKRSPRIYGHSS